MNKLLLGLSAMSLSFLALGTHVASANLIFWFASGSVHYEQVRVLLIIMLLVQLFTRPPRHVVVRLLTGGVGLTVALWTVWQSWSYQMPALDTLAFLSASVALAVIALEHRVNIDHMFEVKLKSKHDHTAKVAKV